MTLQPSHRRLFMNPGFFPVPAFVATVFFLSFMAFIPVHLQASAKAEDNTGTLKSSGSDNTACDLPPFSELLNKEGSKAGARLRELPPLDSDIPSKVASATFAMG
jgi:hypothetical protein